MLDPRLKDKEFIHIGINSPNIDKSKIQVAYNGIIAAAVMVNKETKIIDERITPGLYNYKDFLKYNDAIIDKIRFDTKPRFGLWAVKHDDINHWNLRLGYTLEESRYENFKDNMPHTIFKLKDDCNIFYVDLNVVNDPNNIYSGDRYFSELNDIGLPNAGRFRLDRIVRDFDGMFLDKSVLEEHSFIYKAWDVESLVMFNLEKIDIIY